jgi:hypothetical protein
MILREHQSIEPRGSLRWQMLVEKQAHGTAPAEALHLQRYEGSGQHVSPNDV